MAKRTTGNRKRVTLEPLDLGDKKEVNIEEGLKAVGAEKKENEAIIPPKTKKPAEEPETPKTDKSKQQTNTKKSRGVKKKKTQEQEETVRIAIDLPKSEHKRLKILAMNEDVKLYEYVYAILREHLEAQ